MKSITHTPFTPELLSSKAYFWNCRTKEDIETCHKSGNPGDLETLLAIVQNNRKLFSLITTTIPTMDGWTTIPKACALASLTLAVKPISAVEIGIWAGRSLLPIAMAMQSLGTGVVTGIDPYSSHESSKEEYGENAKWWSEQDHKAIKGKFLHFVNRFNLETHVRHIEKPSDEVDLKGFKIELLHIDGSHTDQAVRDAERYGALVPVGGIAVLDDLTWVGGGVLRAIDTLEDVGFSEVFRKTNDGDNWNVMQRVN